MSLFRRLLTQALNPSSGASQLPPILERTPEDAGAPAAPGRGLPWREVLFNFPLLFGGAIVLGLFLVVLFGPLWAPTNPYIAGQHIVPHFDPQADAWISPPLDPSAEYPLGTDEWGNDILSMLLYGARNTLVAGAFITMVRVLVGLILGSYAGWNEGGLGDQAIMGFIGLTTSVPALISSMILIFALDIRQGLPVFIIALAATGWTEIAQYIRGEFLVLRRKPFIESARSVGAPNLAIAVRHVLPNLLPQLLVISFLEIGAVLTLLGELGFIGVYIGGGSRIALGDELTGIQVVTLIEAPEWGAMLAEGYRWLRAKPFIVFPPAIAFFTAVIGFNTLSEGLRRLIESHALNTAFLLRKRMLLVIAALTAATVFIINNTGPAPWFARVARAFDGGSAYTFTEELAAMDGRGAGQPGSEAAAQYLAERFAGYGLLPGWRSGRYLYNREVTLVEPLAQPELALLGPDEAVLQSFRHRLDFGYQTGGHAGSGEAAAPLTFVAFDAGPQDLDWEAFKTLDLRSRIVLLQEGNAPASFVTEALIRGALGVLWLAPETSPQIPSQNQLNFDRQPYLQEPTLPVFRVQPAVGEALLASAGLTLADLFAPDPGAEGSQRGPGWAARHLDAKVQMSLQLGEPRAVELPAVLGFLPGSDYAIASELLVLVAAYDGPGTDPDGTAFPAANHNASGVAILLELARLWQEQDLNPRRSVLFVAWGGGELEDPAFLDYLQGNRSFTHLPAPNAAGRFTPQAVIYLDSLGGGGDALATAPGASRRLLELLEESGAPLGVSLDPQGQSPIRDPSLGRPARAEWLALSWSGEPLPPHQDTFDGISAEKLQIAGELLSHMLTRIVRETRY